MGALEDFLGRAEKPAESKPVGTPWYASVACQFCNEAVYEQTLYPTDKVLIWTCSQGHKSFMENYSAF